MMMRMLQAGGVPILTDGLRARDASNPHGYFEYDPVKRLHEDPDARWLTAARGRAVKIVSSQLTWLPETNNYLVIFMRRDLDEVLRSQQRMLEESGTPDGSAGAQDLREAYSRHLEEVDRFVARRPAFTVLRVDYARVVASPLDESRRVAAFLSRRLDLDRMAGAVDSTLYRNRAQA